MAKVLEGVPPLSWRVGERYTPVGALKAAATYLGKDVTYAWLMGVSGAAFRLVWSPEWSPSMAYRAPEDLLANAARWLGLAATHRRNDLPNDVWYAIRGSIDAGLPVLTCGLAGAPEYGVIVGYAEEPQRLHVRSYFQGQDAPVVVDFQPWFGWTPAGSGRTPLTLLEPAEGPTEAERGELVAASLERALRFAALGETETEFCEEHQQTHVHVIGLEAYDAWIASLAGLDSVEDLEMKAFAQALALNGLLDARRSAGEYLQILAAMTEDRASTAYRRASEHYGHLVSVLTEARRVLPFPFDAPEDAAKRAAAALASGRARQDFARLLESARKEEVEALAWVADATGGEAPR